MALDKDERRSIGRAIWAYTGDDQRTFAAASGIKYDRLRAALNDDAKSRPTTEELLGMCDAAGIPRDFAIDGWAGDDPIQRLAKRLQALEDLVLAAAPEPSTGARPVTPALDLLGPGLQEAAQAIRQAREEALSRQAGQDRRRGSSGGAGA